MLLAVLAAPPAAACRCAPQPLATYFAQADVVMFARVDTAPAADGEVRLQMTPLLAPYKGRFDRADRYVTADNSAACGLAVESGHEYLIFGQRDSEQPQRLHVNTCNGSRIFPLRGAGTDQAFVDVPTRHVAAQLMALQGMDILAAMKPIAEDDIESQALIGLLDLESLAHGAAIEVHAEPDAASAVLARAMTVDEFATREASYEFPAAVVHARLPGWWRLRHLGAGYGWIEAHHAGTWWPYESLPVGRLAYLNADWDGYLWPDIGAGLPQRAASHEMLADDDARREFPATVLEAQRIGGMLWFRVDLLQHSPCDGGEPRTVHSGWVPAYGRSGQPAVWFYSRGC